jgi:hypothetical protein
MKEILDRLDRIDTNFQRIDANFQQIDRRFQRLEGKMDAGFQKQGVQLEVLQGDVTQALEGISGNRKLLDDKFDEVLRKFDERVQPVELASRHFAREIASLRPRPRTKRKKQA